MMNNYISIYDDVLSKNYCQDLIKRFESNPQHHDTVHTTHDTWKMSFTQINLYEHDIFRDDVSALTQLFGEAIEQYKIDNGIEPHQWPQKYTLEQIRMKRYLPGGNERFDAHVDVSDYDSARRFLAAFFYLNDDFIGGETDFPKLQIMAKPKPGRLIMFPPMWGWTHRSHPIVSGTPKYIIGTYAHYT